ncbi:P-loop containing nucleoside triphosphate hydrolase protein [Daldinia decipiens]|uniref:P-loop containing nucleoside triphosphate hydrolase protein n=1 Tax=Daldinia decipiens TaxID=326647 RepID=UPI0020C4A34F|nr:P-loop containing nucleoside triphosphate hydrolase protein [Daldinia decipiens]KAI1653925.1 P-loop containing nucleoside triphosphate hydrolase protein [Daldinia decipiens]
MTMTTTTGEHIRGNEFAPALENVQHPRATAQDLPRDTYCERDSDNESDTSDNEDGSVEPATSTPGSNGGKRSKSWKKWAYKNLMKTVSAAKGAASKPVVSFVKEYLKGTKLIFVVGQTGTGKSTILRELTGLDLKIGYTWKSGTRKYEICPAIIDGEQYIFVDTAGFGASDMDDTASYEDIMSCLQALGPFVTVAGLIFLYGKIENRLRTEDLKTIQWVQCFCGPEFFQNIIIMTNKWDSWSPDDFEEAWERVPELLHHEELNQILDPPGRYSGGTVYHHGFPEGKGSVDSYGLVLNRRRHSQKRGKELRRLVRQHYAKTKEIKLQVVQELESGIPMAETEAAKVLRVDPVKTRIRIEGDRAVVPVKFGPPLTPSLTTKDLPTSPTGQLQVQPPPSVESTPSIPNSQHFTPKHPISESPPIEEATGTGPEPPKTWWGKVLEWFNIGWHIAKFFKGF